MNFLKIINRIRYFIDKYLFRIYGGSILLEDYKDIWKGRPVVVVGNGPSLKNTPLDDFIPFKSIGMNKINLIFDQTSWRPSVITCVNRHVVSQNRNFFSNTLIPTFVAWQSRFFLKKPKSPNVNYFFNSDKVYFSKNFHEVAGAGATVTFTALQLAYYTGADPVILVGVDHSFNAEGAPHETQIRKGDDPNYFHPDYFANGVKWNLPDLETSEIAYKLADEAFKKDGRQIFDATVNGKLNIFPKIKIDEALSILRLKKK